MINGMILILIVNFPFLDGDVPLPMVYTFRNLFVLREYVQQQKQIILLLSY